MAKLLTSLFLLLAIMVCGQDTINLKPFPHKIIAKRSGEGIKLRWAPNSAASWWDTKDQPIDIYRAEIVNGRPSEFSIIAKGIKVEELSEFETRLNKDPNPIIAAVAYAFYGEWESFKGKEQEKQNWGNKIDELESKYLALLYACDTDFEVAKIAGLGFEDLSVEDSKSYAYKLQFPNTEEFMVKHKSVWADTSQISKLVIDKWDEGEYHISIGWNRNIYEKMYSGFYIERSKDNITFERLNEVPFVHVLTDDIEDVNSIIYTDSVDFKKEYYYRIIGVDAFGELSRPSASVKLKSRDRTPPTLPILDPIALSQDQSEVNISWSFKEKDEDLKTIYINKARKADGPYQVIAELEPNATNFIDKNPSIVMDQYYQVCVVDEDNNIQCAYPKYAMIKDRIAPMPPTGLSGSIDSNGVVNLSWNLGSELDLYGYKIHVSNSINRPFTTITQQIYQDTIWRDTLDLSTLTEYIYCKVTAFDLRQNASEYSLTIRLKKPDLVPPTASVFKSYEIKHDSIILHFALCKDGDVVKHHLMKKSEGDFNIVAQLDLDQNTYVDTNIIPNKKYTYKIITYDDDENSTPSSTELTLKSRKEPKHIPVLNGEKVDDGFLLSWETQQSTIEKVRVYKSLGGKMLTHKWVKNENEYLDLDNQAASYQVKYYYLDGSTSRMSNRISKPSE